MRYTMISIVLLLISFGVIYKLFEATIIDAGAWNARAERELSRVATIAPERGNILADNGNILACNLKVYDIMLDLRHNKIRKLRQIPWQSIDSLADSLDTYFPRRAGLNAHPDTFAKYMAQTPPRGIREESRKTPHQPPHRGQTHARRLREGAPVPVPQRLQRLRLQDSGLQERTRHTHLPIRKDGIPLHRASQRGLPHRRVPRIFRTGERPRLAALRQAGTHQESGAHERHSQLDRRAYHTGATT